MKRSNQFPHSFRTLVSLKEEIALFTDRLCVQKLNNLVHILMICQMLIISAPLHEWKQGRLSEGLLTTVQPAIESPQLRFHLQGSSPPI